MHRRLDLIRDLPGFISPLEKWRDPLLSHIKSVEGAGAGIHYQDTP